VLQEAVTRTTALREALGQLHGQLEELREDHKQLQVHNTATQYAQRSG
jgi:predicted nuclease with TOPRIM domain